MILVIGILGFLALGFLAGWVIGRLNRVDRRLGSITAAVLVIVAGTFALGGGPKAVLTVAWPAS